MKARYFLTPAIPAWKMQALALKAHRQAALEAQAGCCKYCFEPLTPEQATAEHRRAKKNGGQNVARNIDAACSRCNQLKAAQTENQFLKALKHPPAGSPLELLLAHSRRRIWLKTHRACRDIGRACGFEERLPIGPKPRAIAA